MRSSHSFLFPPLQILVPLRGFLLRAVHMEAGVHRGRLHGGGVLRRPGGDRLHARHEEEDLPLRSPHPNRRTQHLPGRGAI